jgi:hypothetical protein
LQVQAVSALHALHDAPVFTGQDVHAAVPIVFLNVKAGHTVQGPPFGPVNPRLQLQFWMDTLWMGEFEFTGHARHVETAVAARLTEY